MIASVNCLVAWWKKMEKECTEHNLAENLRKNTPFADTKLLVNVNIV